MYEIEFSDDALKEAAYLRKTELAAYRKLELLLIELSINPRFGTGQIVKVKYADFKIITRSKTLPLRIAGFATFWNTARELMRQVDLSAQPVRLLGLGISNAADEPEQKYTQLELDLF